MTTEELLQWADDIVFTNTEKHLDSVQTAILEGAWQGLKYEEIAKKCHRSKSHIKNIAAELWQTLSELLGENIHKANARSVLERKAISNIYNYGNSLEIVGSYINSPINICPENRQYPEDARHRSPSNSNSPSSQNQPTIIDLTEAPELTDYYPRPTEESTLKQWILEDGMRLVTLYGLSGIGKSALTVKLIQDIQTEFDYIIWRSLGNPPPFSTLQTELYQFFSQSQPHPCATLIDYLRSFRCLIILDDVQNLFKSGEIAGQYLAEYEDYGKFFKQLATSSHRSCVILLSWENSRELATLEAEKRPLRSLHLPGLELLSAEQILKDKGLNDETQWAELIRLYQGHPCWLNIIASTILELFNGNLSLFLSNPTEIFLGDLEPLLLAHLERLSDAEKTVSGWLALQGEAVEISPHPVESGLSKSEFWQAIQSLARRGLVEKLSVESGYRFRLNPVFQHYIQSQLK
ncbi:NB-ARC domain-containing protein [Laspinema olomoucense]|uniref:NB-ARC domain-containing protein n=1 Tax=Laspinema olomoucense TaxID=3231600 RepID=UPI0021BB66DC|nr:NB-ARC domain-containing protein [Laspinema sp. D3c]MCT7992238.1 NB-ARC domain-containing protein [Laspinema sp. D3c]